MTELSRSPSPSWVWLIAIIAIVIATQALIGSAIYYSHASWDTRGQFGDMFGAVNTLFSGLAFAGFLCAIYLQREDLRLQRQDLALTRNELSRAAQAQEQSATSMAKQAVIRVLTAQVSAASALLSSVEARLERISITNDPGVIQQRKELRAQRQALTQTLDRAYMEINKHLPPNED